MPRARPSTAREAANAETAALVVPYMTANGLGMYDAAREGSNSLARTALRLWVVPGRPMVQCRREEPQEAIRGARKGARARECDRSVARAGRVWDRAPEEEVKTTHPRSPAASSRPSRHTSARANTQGGRRTGTQR
eukprot:5107222-Prymnesium_polylepis.1